MNLISDDLNQKLTKHSQKTLDMGRLHGGKYLGKNLGIEKGGGCLLEGSAIFGSLRYSILADETKDSSKREQLAIELRYVDVAFHNLC